MSLAENLLETLDSSPNARTADPVSEPHIVVGNDRRIVVPPELKLIAVTGDKDVETVTIDCVRYWDEHDLSTFAIYINYTLPDGTKGSYIPFELNVEEDKFSFEWTIGKEMTLVSGALEFLILARMVDDNGNEQYQWSSLPNSECSIAEGKDFLYTPETSEQQDQISQIIIASQQAILQANEAVQKAEDAAERAEAAMGKDVENRLLRLEDAVADLQYVEIVVGTFSASPSTAEMGSTVSSVALSWAVNKTPTALTLDGAAVDVVATSKTVTGAFTANVPGVFKTWTLKATDERGATSSKTASLSFLNGVYYGVATEPAAYDSAFILRLTKNLRSSKLTSFSVNAGSGQYIYYCLPKRMGTCSFKVGGFDGGFSLVDTISFTNASGCAEDYYVYRSDNAGLGQTAVTVS